MNAFPSTKTSMGSRGRAAAFLLLAGLLHAPGLSHGQCSDYSDLPLMTAADGLPDDVYGSSVSVDGELALVGAPWSDGGAFSSGSAYAYRWNGSSWAFVQKLLPSVAQPNGQFGTALRVDGDTAAIGAFGVVHIYRWNGSSWSPEQVLSGDGVFGAALDLEGDSLVVGWGCRVFRRSGTLWSLEADIPAACPRTCEEEFGKAVAIHGERVLVGAPMAPQDPCEGCPYIFYGNAYVYRHEGAAWVLEQALRAVPVPYFSWFGQTVALADDLALVGSPGYPGGFAPSVSAYRRTGTTWVQEQTLVAGTLPSNLGVSLAVEGERALVGDTDRIHAFDRVGSSWIETQTVTTVLAGSGFGRSLSLSGDIAWVGMPFLDLPGGSDHGGAVPLWNGVFVDCDYTGFPLGTFQAPYSSLGDAVQAVCEGGNVLLKSAGHSCTAAPLTITKALTIKSINGENTIR